MGWQLWKECLKGSLKGDDNGAKKRLYNTGLMYGIFGGSGSKHVDINSEAGCTSVVGSLQRFGFHFMSKGETLEGLNPEIR